MIGDPPNIIIGNMLGDYVSFNDFIIFLAPGVFLCLPASNCKVVRLHCAYGNSLVVPHIAYVVYRFFHSELEQKMDVDADQLIRDNPIRDRYGPF